MEIYEFIENCKDKHLTLGDLEKLKFGDTLDVVIWDRNFEECWIWDGAERNVKYDPKYFFRENHHTIKYLGDYMWDINFNFGGTYSHPVHLDVSSMDTNWKWYALENNEIKITYEVLNKGEKIPKGKKAPYKHITEFDKNTRVGWRGPIMLWDELDNLPNVYLK